MLRIGFPTILSLLIQTTPVHAASCINAEVLEQVGSGKKNESLLREVLRMCPGHVVAPNNLALLLENAGRLLNEAKTYYHLATEAAPVNPAPWAGAGRYKNQ